MAFVDVPGHERFVRTMLAGVGGIDCVLLIVAADESVMPQTREHFDICRLLRIPRGLVVLTKSDLADADTRALVRQDVAELVKGSFLEPRRRDRGVGDDRGGARSLARGDWPRRPAQRGRAADRRSRRDCRSIARSR